MLFWEIMQIVRIYFHFISGNIYKQNKQYIVLWRVVVQCITALRLVLALLHTLVWHSIDWLFDNCPINQSILWLIYQLVDCRLINRGINQLMVHGTPGLLASLSPSLKLGILRWSSKMSLSRRFKNCLSSPPAPLRSQRSHRGWGTLHKGKHRQGSCKQELAGRRWCRCHRRSSTWRCLSPPRRCLGWAGRCGRSEER